jgi:uncharacterized phage-like protein YoqJ
MKIAVTGHRPQKLGNEYQYDGPYSTYLREKFREILIKEQPSQCITGMALGVDTLFCQVAIELAIPVLAAIPFPGQETRWPPASQELYTKLLSNSLVTAHLVSSGPYNSAKMQIRNEYMVDKADKLVAVWNGSAGGTMNCVRYAEKNNKNIIRINPEGWKPQQEDIQPILF